MSVTEFSSGEVATAVVTMEIDEGAESYIGPIQIGYYTNGDGGEVWLEQEGKRVNILPNHFKDVMKQLRRAHDIAATKE